MFQSIARRSLAAIVSIQMVALPVLVNSAPAMAQQAVSPAQVRSTLARGFGRAKTSGWIFRDADGNEMTTAALASGSTNGEELQAIPPKSKSYGQSIGFRMSLAISGMSMKYYVSAYNRGSDPSMTGDPLTGRTISLNASTSDVDRETLVLKQSLNALMGETLTKLGVRLGSAQPTGFFEMAYNWLIPSAQADFSFFLITPIIYTFVALIGINASKTAKERKQWLAGVVGIWVGSLIGQMIFGEQPLPGTRSRSRA